ncbi:hypothetical protein BZG36_00101 [Bifiguratus adelaidae]|uniref:Uncharacterized protein n=1 Tax=Bifiguratus adelaidae TaxID=1938954 RepID=A0A261Y867_9FUNG|nr:hypothetical protein BZG36_00101 [Bifiguratus adelaidae]
MSVLSDIQQRQLRPLYDAIDLGQHKQALQQCSKILKKQPDFVLVKALNAVVLTRVGRSEEAQTLLKQVKKAQPTDEATLQAATLAFRELGEPGEIVSMYENAAKKQPNNEEFGVHWFMAMVRSQDYKGQQQAALKLHKTFKKDKYMFWNIMSMLLQAKNATDTNNIMYTLMERMLVKAAEEGKIKATEEVRLYLLVLLGQNKHKEALELLESDLAAKSQKDPDVKQIKLDLLWENKRYGSIIETAKASLEQENADDWISWEWLMQSVFQEQGSGQTVQDTQAFILRVQAQALKNPILKRGPFLAQVDYQYRLWQQEGQSTSVEKLQNAIISYFDRFGSKSCFFEDVSKYLDAFKARDAKEALLSRMREVKNIENSESEPKSKLRKIQRQVSIRKTEFYVGLYHALSEQGMLNEVNDLCEEYHEALPLGAELEASERQHGDDFLILAVHLLLLTYQRNPQNITLIVQSIIILEAALRRSIHNFQFKLLLVRLYLLLGVQNRPLELFRTMDFKHVQLDTLMHYFTDRSEDLAFYDRTIDLLGENLQIYRSNEVESPEMLVKAYQYGTFSKVEEFMDFRRRLDNSLQHTITDLQYTYIELVQHAFSPKHAIKFVQDLKLDGLKVDDAFITLRSDNRDFSVLLDCTPVGSANVDTLSKPTTAASREWTRVKALLLHIVRAAVLEESQEVFKGHLTLLSDKLTSLNFTTDLISSEAFVASAVATLGEFLCAVQSDGNTGELAERFKELCTQQVIPVISSTDELRWSYFHHISKVLEMSVFAGILLEVTTRALPNLKKAKQADGADPETQAFKAIHDTLKDILAQAQTSLKTSVKLLRAKSSLQDFRKKVTEDVAWLPYAQKLDPAQLDDTVRSMHASWLTSCQALQEEVDRRLKIR